MVQPGQVIEMVILNCGTAEHRISPLGWFADIM